MTINGLCTVRKDYEGRTEIVSTGPVTVALEAMMHAELIEEWGWLVDECLPGATPTERRLTARGFRVSHAAAGPLGVLIQASVTRIHVEWYDPISEDHMYAGRAQRLRYGVAYILNARRSGGSPVPMDPEPFTLPVAAPPALPKPGDIARYCGSLAELCGQLVRVHYCWCDEDFCAGYRAEPLTADLPEAVHVRRTSFAVEPA